MTGHNRPKRQFKTDPIGLGKPMISRIIAEGKLRLFAAIDRTSKSAFVKRHCKPAR